MSASILVVDDEPDVADLFRQRFRREVRQGDYVMHFAASGVACPVMVCSPFGKSGCCRSITEQPSGRRSAIASIPRTVDLSRPGGAEPPE